MKRICSISLVICMLVQILGFSSIETNAEFYNGMVSESVNEYNTHDESFVYSQGAISWEYDGTRTRWFPQLTETYNDDIDSSDKKGAFVSYTFKGTGIEIFGETNTDGGTAEVEIYKGNVLVSTAAALSFYSNSRKAHRSVFVKKDLPQDQYTMKLAITSEDGKWIVLDSVKVFSADKVEPNVIGATQIIEEGQALTGTYEIKKDGTDYLKFGEQGSITFDCKEAPNEIDLIAIKGNNKILASALVTGVGERTLEFTMPTIQQDSSLVLQLIGCSINKQEDATINRVNTSDICEFSAKGKGDKGGWWTNEGRKGDMNLPLLEVYKDDLDVVAIKDAWAKYDFSGSYVALYGEVNTDGGEAKIEVFKNDQELPLHTKTVSYVASERIGMTKLFERELEQGEYTLKITATEVGDNNRWVTLDAIEYIDKSHLAKGLSSQGIESINSENTQGEYQIVSSGSQQNLEEGEQVVVALYLENDLDHEEVITLKDGDEVLQTKVVSAKGIIPLSFKMPANNIDLSVCISRKVKLPIQYWIDDALERLPKDTKVGSSPKKKMILDMARNEYEGQQIILKHNSNFKVMGIQFEDLIGENGLIAKENLQYNFVDYEARGEVDEEDRVGRNGEKSPEQLYPTNRQLGTKLPDPLSNNKVRDVKENEAQPILVTANTSKNIEAGVYKGKFTINTNSEDIVVPIEINVYDVTIPEVKDSSYTIYNWASDLGYSFQWPYDGPKVYYGLDERYTEEWWQVIDSWTDSMIEHRQNMYLINTPQLLIDGGTTIEEDGTVHFNWSKFDEFLNRLIDKGFVQFGGMHLVFHWDGNDPLGYAGKGRGRTGILKRNGSDDNIIYRGEFVDHPDSVRYYQQFFKALTEHLETIEVSDNQTALDVWYQHVFDEPKYAPRGGADWRYIAQMIKNYAVIKDENNQIIKRMKTSDADASGILKSNSELVDRWVPDLRDYENDKDYYDNLIAQGKDVTTYVCVSPPAPYLNRFTTQDNITGLLLSWYAEKNKLNNILHWGFNVWYMSNDTTPGDAEIVYPDRENLSIKKSLRYEAMRDGIEDYELLHILREINSEMADEIIESMVVSATKYSTNLSHYRRVREALLKAASGDNNVQIPAQEIDGYIKANDHETIVNDDGTEISLSEGWTHKASRGSEENIATYNGDTTIAKSSGEEMSFQFTGTGLRVYGEQGENFGEYSLVVKDKNEQVIDEITVNQEGKRKGLVKQYENRDLEYNSYTLTITTQDNKTVGIDAIVWENSTNFIPVNKMWNDASKNITYEGAKWLQDKGRQSLGDYKGDAHCTNKKGDFVEFTFEGTGIKFYTEEYSDMGEYDIYIDNEKVKTVSSYHNGTRKAQRVKFANTSLPYGVHTIKIVNINEGKWMVIDAFEVFNNVKLVDKGELEMKYQSLILLEKEYYTEESFNNLIDALKKVKIVLDNETATNIEINEANLLLLIAESNLVTTVEPPKNPFIIKDGLLDREKGLKATVKIHLNNDPTIVHEQEEVVIFQLLRDGMPVNIIALEKDFMSSETLSSYFNVEDPENMDYSIEVFVFDKFYLDETTPKNLADKCTLQ